MKTRTPTRSIASALVLVGLAACNSNPSAGPVNAPAKENAPVASLPVERQASVPLEPIENLRDSTLVMRQADDQVYENLGTLITGIQTQDGIRPSTISISPIKLAEGEVVRDQPVRTPKFGLQLRCANPSECRLELFATVIEHTLTLENPKLTKELRKDPNRLAQLCNRTGRYISHAELGGRIYFHTSLNFKGVSEIPKLETIEVSAEPKQLESLKAKFEEYLGVLKAAGGKQMGGGSTRSPYVEGFSPSNPWGGSLDSQIDDMKDYVRAYDARTHRGGLVQYYRTGDCSELR